MGSEFTVAPCRLPDLLSYKFGNERHYQGPRPPWCSDPFLPVFSYFFRVTLTYENTFRKSNWLHFKGMKILGILVHCKRNQEYDSY